jgi:hypothetical protein
MHVIVFLLLLAGVIAPIILINLRGRNRVSQTGGSEKGKTNSESSLSPLTVLTGVAALVLAVLLILMVAWFCYAVFRWPAVTRLRDAAQLATLFANLALTCYAFPAYTRTKRRPFLALGFAALSFAYGALFSIVFAPSQATAAWRTTHSEAQWYYASREVTTILGLILYAYACISLARAAKSPNATVLSPNG